MKTTTYSLLCLAALWPAAPVTAAPGIISFGQQVLGDVIQDVQQLIAPSEPAAQPPAPFGTRRPAWTQKYDSYAEFFGTLLDDEPDGLADWERADMEAEIKAEREAEREAGSGSAGPTVQHFSAVSAEDWPINLLQYAQDKVWRFHIQNSEERQIVKRIATELGLSIWGSSRSFVDIQTDPAGYAAICGALEGSRLSEFGLGHSELISDLPQAVYETFPQDSAADMDFDTLVARNPDGTLDAESFHNYTRHVFFANFQTFPTMWKWLNGLQSLYPELITTTVVGQTYEGRSQRVFEVSEGSDEKAHKKRQILISAGIHAREWISTSSVCYSIYKLVTEYGVKKGATEFLNHLNFAFVPVGNPDGYEYSWSHDRLWRKNRQATLAEECFGIDIDHSFGYKWTHSDDLPCGEDYSGEYPYAAIEANNWSKVLNSTPIYAFDAYLDWHSYSQEILYPYAYSCEEVPRDLENLEELGYGLAKAIRLASGKKFDVLSACEDRDMFGTISGGSALDYFYHEKARWAFQVKLRDTGNHGFVLPPKFIKPVGREMFASLRYFCRFLIEPPV